MNEINYFFNERMKVLLVIQEHQIEIGNVSVCPLNQQEIASLVPCSKLKVNQIIKELSKEGYVDTLREKGRYILTPKSLVVIERHLI